MTTRDETDALAASMTAQGRQMQTAVEKDLRVGRWIPIYFGNKFKVARLGMGRRNVQEERPGVYVTLGDAQAECDRLNSPKS
jgi:hypothetical protein